VWLLFLHQQRQWQRELAVSTFVTKAPARRCAARTGEEREREIRAVRTCDPCWSLQALRQHTAKTRRRRLVGLSRPPVGGKKMVVRKCWPAHSRRIPTSMGFTYHCQMSRVVGLVFVRRVNRRSVVAASA